MVNERVGQQDRRAVVCPSVVALAALRIKRGKYGKKR